MSETQLSTSSRNLLLLCTFVVVISTFRNLRPSMMTGFFPSSSSLSEGMLFSYQQTSTSRRNPHCSVNTYSRIARKRRLRHPQAAEMLRTIVQHDEEIRPFHPATDLFVFEHIIKTGGTSFSNLLLQQFGTESTVPGSRESGFFNRDEFLRKASRHNQTVDDYAAWWDTLRVMYSHSYFQQGSSNKEDELAFEDWFLAQIPIDTTTGQPRKRVWMGTIYRHPLEWMASNFFEWMCRLRGRMEEVWAGTHPHSKKRRNSSPMMDKSCWGLNNLTMLADYWFQHTLPRKCREGTLDNKRLCRTYERTGQDGMLYCRSASHFAESDIFRDIMQDNPPYLIVDHNESVVALEERTLQRYGGLIPHAKVPVAWLGLTERYEESLVLFYDWMQWPLDDSFGKAPKMRYKPCRPTSFWSDDDKQMLARLTWRSWVVHNVANAILDVRMAEWCCRQSTQDAGNPTDAIFDRFCNDDM